MFLVLRVVEQKQNGDTKWRNKMAEPSSRSQPKRHTHTAIHQLFTLCSNPFLRFLSMISFFLGGGEGGVSVPNDNNSQSADFSVCMHLPPPQCVCGQISLVEVWRWGRGGKLHLRFILMSSDWLSAISAARASVDSIPYSHRSSFVLFGWVFFRLFVCLVPAPPTGKKKTNEDRHPLVVHR